MGAAFDTIDAGSAQIPGSESRLPVAGAIDLMN
jgi:hypothetical protein